MAALRVTESARWRPWPSHRGGTARLILIYTEHIRERGREVHPGIQITISSAEMLFCISRFYFPPRSASTSRAVSHNAF